MELSPDVASIMDFRQASVVVFEKKGVVSMEWASEAAKILDEHGFFYQANEEIGSLCGELYNEYVNNEELKQFMPHLMPMDHVVEILQHYELWPLLSWSLSSDPGYYFASTPGDSKGGLILYMWGSDTELELCDKSHVGELAGRSSWNGLAEINLPLLENQTLGFIKIKMDRGGMYVVADEMWCIVRTFI